MQRALAVVLALGLFLIGWADAGGVRTSVTPVQKVIALLTGMLEKGKLNKHEEQVQFASFKQFCEDTISAKQKSVSEADEEISMLKAGIQKYTADAAELSKEITGHDADVAIWSGDLKAATKVRQIEKADYDKTHKDYSESIDAIQRAVSVLKKQSHDREQSAFTQVGALRDFDIIPKDAKRAIDIFLSQADDATQSIEEIAPTPNAYEFQSHGIIEMLEKLMEKFVDERTELEKNEMNTRHAYEMLVQDLKSQTEQAKQERSSAAANKAKALQDKADAEGSLEDTSSTRKVDMQYFSDLQSECTMKASDFETRQQLRAEELQTLEKAIEIISGNAVAGAAAKHLPSLLAHRAASFVHLRSATAPAVVDIKQERAAQFLRDQARHLNSHVLSTLAVKVTEDPFTKVKKMIKDLITRLMEEANEEAEHKGWCDTELSTNDQTRKEKTSMVETLHAEIDELKANMAEMSEEITMLTKQVADLDKAVAESTNIRQKEKAENAATIQDASDAQTAVAQALLVMKEFYAKAGEATALLQEKQKPEIFSSPYRGMGSDSGGVIGMLEVIESDFARLESDTTQAEAVAAKAYNEFMTESKVDKASKNKDIEHKSARKQDAAQTLASKTVDLEGTQKELDAALTYYEKLKPSCVDAGVSYGERVARRKEEIESLQEALKILNGEDI
jgi:tetratricopeptide (TPR) repeat protein